MTPITINFMMAFSFSLLENMMFRSHLMSTLLCLEGMMLSLFILIITLALNTQSMITYVIPIIMLVFAACEAAIGLALLVIISNTYCTDYVQNLNLFQY
uniref:NADH-ubiquinone oxidoreductase chain 4L n=1 Tax=Oryzomys palustris TaxID=37020 RepID=O21561_ORYPA|nr:NADH dehydrogenase subunit 4L [Oryzomys palustris]